MERPVGVTIIAVLQFLGVGLLIIVGLFCLLGMSFLGSVLGQLGETRNAGGALFTAFAGLGAVLAVFFFVFAVISVLLGWGMLNLKNWARIIAMVLCIISIFFGSIGILFALLHFNVITIMFGGVRLAINVLIVWYLLQSDVKRVFV